MDLEKDYVKVLEAKYDTCELRCPATTLIYGFLLSLGPFQD